jgi:hypothetical protein
MPTPIDPKRLPRLKKAQADVPDGERWSQKQLAELYGVANSRFTTLVHERFPGFPPHERRDDKTHWYEAKPAIASMIQYMEDQARGKQAQARRHSAVMGRVEEAVEQEDAGPDPLTAAELDRLASAQTKLFRLRKEMGLYTLTSEVQEISRGLFTMLNREIMNIVNEIDPNGEMTPKQRERVKHRSREIVLKLHDGIGRFLEDEDDAGRAPGITVARGGPGGAVPRRRARPDKGSVASAA